MNMMRRIISLSVLCTAALAMKTSHSGGARTGRSAFVEELLPSAPAMDSTNSITPGGSDDMQYERRCHEQRKRSHGSVEELDGDDNSVIDDDDRFLPLPPTPRHRGPEGRYVVVFKSWQYLARDKTTKVITDKADLHRASQEQFGEYTMATPDTASDVWVRKFVDNGHTYSHTITMRESYNEIGQSEFKRQQLGLEYTYSYGAEDRKKIVESRNFVNLTRLAKVYEDDFYNKNKYSRFSRSGPLVTWYKRNRHGEPTGEPVAELYFKPNEIGAGDGKEGNPSGWTWLQILGISTLPALALVAFYFIFIKDTKDEAENPAHQPADDVENPAQAAE